MEKYLAAYNVEPFIQNESRDLDNKAIEYLAFSR